MNNGRPNYTSAPAYGKQLQNQRAAAQNQYMAGQQGGYPPQQPGYTPQPGGYPQQPQPGYTPQQGGYTPPQQTGYATPQQGGYAPQQPQPGYTNPQGGYAPQQTGYVPPQQGYVPPQGGYAPQQPGYMPQQTGYAPPQPGYNGGYQQMYGGYQPMQPQQPKKGLRLSQWIMIVLCGVLPVLFVLAMIFSSAPVLKWVFIALSAVGVGLLWVKPLVSGNTRITFSAVYGALMVVALVSALTAAAPADTTSNGGGNSGVGAGVLNGTTSDGTANGSGGGSEDSLGAWTTEYAPEPQVTPEPALNASEAVAQTESFFYFWSVNKTDDMVGLCAPSWQSSVEEPKKALFSILANRTPVEYTTEKVTGADADTTRTVTVVASIDKGNGRDPSKYRLQVVMLKEDSIWYVDPRSLSSQEAAESTDDPAATATAAIAGSMGATASPLIDPNTVLYYNPDGGSKYHLDKNCKSTAAKFLPFAGQFTYSQVNDDKYKDLVPCNICNAPLRVQ